MPNETVTYSLEAVLKEIKDSIKEVSQKVDTLNQSVTERLTKLEIGQTEIKGDIKTLGSKVEGIDKRLEKVESEQSNLVKSVSDLQGFRGLILPLVIGTISAVIGAIITVATRFFLIGNNP